MPIPWTEFSSEVLTLYSPPIRRIATYRKMRQVLGEFALILPSPGAPGCPRTGALTPAVVADWITAHPDRRPETTLSMLKTLGAACAYGVTVGAIASNPFDWRKPTAWVDWDVPQLEPPVHSAEEIARVLTKVNVEAAGGSWKAERLKALVYAYAFTGARKREVLGLRLEDIDLGAGVLVIRTNRRRGLKTRASSAMLPIADDLAVVLEHWIVLCGSEWLFPGVTRKGPWLEGPCGAKALDEVKALGVRAGVKGLTINSIRHTFASLAEGWGIGELALQRILRHSRVRTQQAYRHPLPEVLRDVSAKVRY